MQLLFRLPTIGLKGKEIAMERSARCHVLVNDSCIVVRDLESHGIGWLPELQIGDILKTRY
jgi:hypothetical protein